MKGTVIIKGTKYQVSYTLWVSIIKEDDPKAKERLPILEELLRPEDAKRLANGQTIPVELKRRTS